MNRSMHVVVFALAAAAAAGPSSADVLPELGWKPLPHVQVDRRDILVPRDLAVEVCYGGGREYCTRTKTSRARYVCVYDLTSLSWPATDGPLLGPCRDGFCAPQPDGDPAHGFPPHGHLPPPLYAVRIETIEEQHTRIAECRARSIVTDLQPIYGDSGPTGSDLDLLCQLQGRPGPLPLTDEFNIVSYSPVACDSLRHLPELFD